MSWWHQFLFRELECQTPIWFREERVEILQMVFSMVPTQPFYPTILSYKNHSSICQGLSVVTVDICFFFKDVLILYVWVFCLHVCLCTTCMLDTHRGQKRVSDSLQPELHMVVSCSVDAGNQTFILRKNSRGSLPLSHLSSSSVISTWSILSLF